MADEIVTYTWCDVHQREHDEKVDAAEHKTVITIDGLTRRLDLCPACWSALIGPVIDRMEAYGTRDDAKAATKAPKPPKAAGPRAEAETLPYGRVIYKTSDPVTVFDVQVSDDGRAECLFCERDLNSTTGAYRHMETEHSVDLPSRLPTPEWRAAHPEVDVEALMCPEHRDEGVVFLARGGQGLGAHRRSAHHVVGTSEYAERRAASKVA